MKFEKGSSKIILLHRQRFENFAYELISEEKKYFESKITSLITLAVTVAIITIIFYTTDYKEGVTKIGIFAVAFNLYKIYQAFFVPILSLNKNGVEVRAIKIPWKTIKKSSIRWKNNGLHLTIELTNNILINEKVEAFKFIDYITLHSTFRAFKAKHRRRYIFRKLI